MALRALGTSGLETPRLVLGGNVFGWNLTGAEAFRALIDAALALEGSFYLTYHRFATPEQVLAAYPGFPEFLRLKLLHDPHERFQSDWYRFYKTMFADVLAP